MQLSNARGAACAGAVAFGVHLFGPVIALDTEGANNVMTFQIGPSPAAAKRAVLEAYYTYPPEKTGHSLICIGRCLVGGALANVAAYRPT